MEMLTKPDSGWSGFRLEGTSLWVLSYITDIPFEWLYRAVHGLEADEPFFVEAFMEPGRFLCRVSRSGCEIEIHEPDARVIKQHSSVAMPEFCRHLHDDIIRDIDCWALWNCRYSEESDEGYSMRDFEERKRSLSGLLRRIEEMTEKARMGKNDHP